MKTNKIYYFSVEGETELWYLEWLQKEINNLERASCRVKFDVKVCPNAKTRAKSISNLNPIEITHVIDVEGKEQKDIIKFKNSLDKMKEAEKLGKKIKYKLAYSNISFELWILLHKTNCFQSFISNKGYLKLINSNFNQNYSRLREYKKEDNFKRLLNNLNLDDVCQAIIRAKIINERNIQCNKILYEHRKYKYYLDNPATSVWVIIERIFNDCEIL